MLEALGGIPTAEAVVENFRLAPETRRIIIGPDRTMLVIDSSHVILIIETQAILIGGERSLRRLEDMAAALLGDLAVHARVTGEVLIAGTEVPTMTAGQC